MRLTRLSRKTIRYLRKRKTFLRVFMAGFLLGTIVTCFFDYYEPDECKKLLANISEEKNTENFEPYVLQYVNHTSAEPFLKKRNRPIFAATELNIREKLFIAVLSSEQSLNTLGVAINKSIGHYKAKVAFFVDRKSSIVPNGMLLVNFNDGYKQYLPFNTLKYMIKEFGSWYDYYMLLSDRGYIRAENVFNFVSHISVSKQVYLGSPTIKDGNTILCALEGGILLSQSFLDQINSSLKWCIANSNSTDESVNLGRCLFHALRKDCQNSTYSKLYASYHLQSFNFTKDIDSLAKIKDFNSSLSIYPILDNITHYSVHRYFCEVELSSIKNEIQQIKEDMYNKSEYAPGGRDSVSWPITVPESYKPRNKFDVINWVYFTETHIFFQDEFSNVKILIGADKQDIQSIIKTAVVKLNEIYGNRYLYSHLINGYRKFDPIRGMEYILDLALIDRLSSNESSYHNTSKTVEKRLFLVRPLGEVEFVPMPHVEELQRINIVLTLRPNDLDFSTSFLENYVQLQGPPYNKILALTIVFMYEQKPLVQNEDLYAVLKSMLPHYEKQSGKAVNIRAINFSTNGTFTPEFQIMDKISDLLEPNALILTCTVGMLLNSEMLNRVGINTIPGWQVFFPIGFWQYKPNIIYNKKPFPINFEFNSRTGHYDVLSYEHGSFYNSDYKDARKSFSIEELMKYDLYEMFVRYDKVHVFRAVEPDFKHYYMQLDCPVNIPTQFYERCLERKSLNLATRAQLAKRIFQFQEKRNSQNKTQTQS
ncbi:chondroitin sulfate synthase 2-like [Biomphalaria glabrata]|uniref:Hexosyltransferase n=1 Tax=Biomphalaria glabrata TaxID=6526 RepID=A0A9U8EJ31_BIOGL|nr:chondroitin sulfate synthase 2-like [Biomphalaria glabrata]XP_013089370.2 chondroitin sulfate synthase 2-like [Biomphalaria glabrata]XP_013089377.2 chondroitin sulfate synthase 2-like [Biomphalaria glabrata]XP_055884627.1 chondroitin sulfate synthase 2-like [Biomphalaria glabrata]XP_055884638.1 chondroitin sulfate synthase 2-like [Biomphalaria glabrata]